MKYMIRVDIPAGETCYFGKPMSYEKQCKFLDDTEQICWLFDDHRMWNEGKKCEKCLEFTKKSPQK